VQIVPSTRRHIRQQQTAECGSPENGAANLPVKLKIVKFHFLFSVITPKSFILSKFKVSPTGFVE
jgi:hypothetical protein